MKHVYSYKAFTLVELLCAVALVGVLSVGVVFLVSRTLDSQLHVQSNFSAQQEAFRGFSWLERDVESAWFPLGGEPWYGVEVGFGQGKFCFVRWGEHGVENITYEVMDGTLWRTAVIPGEEGSFKKTQVCGSVLALETRPEQGDAVAITLVLEPKNGDQQTFSRVLVPVVEI